MAWLKGSKNDSYDPLFSFGSLSPSSSSSFDFRIVSKSQVDWHNAVHNPKGFYSVMTVNKTLCFDSDHSFVLVAQWWSLVEFCHHALKPAGNV